MSGADALLSGMRPTWVEIHLDAWRRNLRAARERLPAGSDLVPILKADAYGHGAVELARIAVEERIPLIGVALLEEALELRANHGELPLFVLGPLEPEATDMAAAHSIGLGITGPDRLRIASERAATTGREITVHLKLDSGMGRMGLVPEDLEEAVGILTASPALRLASIYTHFATADEPQHPAFAMQKRRFEEMLGSLRARGVTAAVIHSANSAAIWGGEVRAGDLARAGMLLLGGEVHEDAGSRLEPVLRWRTSIARIKQVEAGEGVGYGHEWIAKRTSRIATLPVGYADGYDRLLSNRSQVLVGGSRVPVIGRISMDLITIDVTDLSAAQEGDEVVLLGHQGEDEIPAEELARLAGTISYEVFCAISSRVPRVWISGRERRVGSRFSRFFAKDDTP